MSTKTTFKRVALVAVAALGLGVLSVAPSSATVSNLTTVVVNGTSAANASDSLTAATITVTGFVNNANDTITVQFIEDGARPTAVSGFTPGVPRINIIDTATTTSLAKPYNADTASTSQWDGFDLADSAAINTEAFEVFSATANRSIGAKFGVQLESASALLYGTYNYTLVVTSYSHAAGGDTKTITTTTVPFAIVVDRPSDSSKTPSALTSFATLSATTTADGAGSKTTSDAAQSIVATAGTAAGYIFVANRNAAGGSATAEDSLTAVVTGAGVICVEGGATCGKSLSKIKVTGDYQFELKADGTAGASSVAITSGVLGTTYTKNLSYYAKDAKTFTASAFTPRLVVGANDSAVVVTAVDANGTNWTGTAYIYPVAAADALVAGSVTTAVACVASTDKTRQFCPLTVKTPGTASFKIGNSATVSAVTVSSDAVSVTATAATAATVKLAFDKATYAPGEKAVVTVTPVDASGNKIAAVSSAALLASSSTAITSNTAVTIGGSTSAVVLADGTALSTAAYDGTDKTNGSFSIVVYMPQASGTVTITAKGGSALPLAGQVAVTASADVVNASVDAATDAANEATDAANAATDAALAAADAADAATAAAQDASDAVAALSASVSKLISSLRAQITSLTNLVIKIQKKVRA
jgi:trimeric autotransporter adhesin